MARNVSHVCMSPSGPVMSHMSSGHRQQVCDPCSCWKMRQRPAEHLSFPLAPPALNWVHDITSIPSTPLLVACFTKGHDPSQTCIPNKAASPAQPVPMLYSRYSTDGLATGDMTGQARPGVRRETHACVQYSRYSTRQRLETEVSRCAYVWTVRGYTCGTAVHCIFNEGVASFPRAEQSRAEQSEAEGTR